MSSAEEVNSMDRILIAIETYRYQTDDRTDLLGNESVHLYLKFHLSSPDWRVWQQLPVNQPARSLLVPEDSTVGNMLAFTQLLGHYKRAVYERIHGWSTE